MKDYLTQEKLKSKNLTDIFEFILKSKKTTRREISEHTGFSWGTVSTNVSKLIDKKYVLEVFTKKSNNVGRPISYLIPNSKAVLIGLDINRSGYMAQIVSIDRTVLKTYTEPFKEESYKETVDIAVLLLSKAMAYCKKGYTVISIGIALQGDVDEESGRSVSFPGFESTENINIKEIVKEKFGYPVFVGHDPKCVLLSLSLGKDKSDCVLIRIDSGIGMAVMTDSIVLDGEGRFEIGNMKTKGKRLNDVATRFAVEERTKEEYFSAEKDYIESGKYSDVFVSTAEYISEALYNVAVVFNPERIIITGNMIKDEKGLGKLIKAQFKEMTEAVNSRTKLYINSNISASFGAAMQSLNEVISSHGI